MHQRELHHPDKAPIEERTIISIESIIKIDSESESELDSESDQ